MWWLLLLSFMIFVAGAYCSYTPEIRRSDAFPWLYMTCTVLVGTIWIFAARRLDDAGKILWFSLCWDALMVAAYYALPIIWQGKSFPWQAVAACGVVVGGLVWAKLSLG